MAVEQMPPATPVETEAEKRHKSQSNRGSSHDSDGNS